MKTKICTRCKKEKSLTAFYKRGGSKRGLRSRCKKCEIKSKVEYRRKNPEWQIQWCKNNPDKIKEITKRTYVKKYFGISLEQYNTLKDKLFQEQRGRCAICGKYESEVARELQLDHNHTTGQTRGLLCIVCNTRLAHLEDLDFVTKAKIYLDEHNSLQKPEIR